MSGSFRYKQLTISKKDLIERTKEFLENYGRDKGDPLNFVDRNLYIIVMNHLLKDVPEKQLDGKVVMSTVRKYIIRRRLQHMRDDLSI